MTKRLTSKEKELKTERELNVQRNTEIAKERDSYAEMNFNLRNKLSNLVKDKLKVEEEYAKKIKELEEKLLSDYKEKEKVYILEIEKVKYQIIEIQKKLKVSETN